MSKREISKIEKNIANDIISRSNYSQEEANKIAKIMVDFGYTIHEQDFYKYKMAIEILKENFPIRFLGYNKYGAKPYEIMINGYIMGFDKEPYELLKEVLEND